MTYPDSVSGPFESRRRCRQDSTLVSESNDDHGNLWLGTDSITVLENSLPDMVLRDPTEGIVTARSIVTLPSRSTAVLRA